MKTLKCYIYESILTIIHFYKLFVGFLYFLSLLKCSKILCQSAPLRIIFHKYTTEYIYFNNIINPCVSIIFIDIQ